MLEPGQSLLGAARRRGARVVDRPPRTAARYCPTTRSTSSTTTARPRSPTRAVAQLVPQRRRAFAQELTLGGLADGAVDLRRLRARQRDPARRPGAHGGAAAGPSAASTRATRRSSRARDDVDGDHPGDARRVVAGPRMTWTNWAGNQSCAARVAAPAERGRGRRARCAARSRRARAARGRAPATPSRRCRDERHGPRDDRPARRHGRSTRRAAWSRRCQARRSREFGDPLWEAGLALANQGDIDTQAIAGAIATGTHGSGNRLPSFSASLRACRLVDGRGEVVEIDETQPELLRAAQVSVGMLGVMTSLTIEVVPAYRCAERIEHWPFEDVLARWDELFAGHRHFSFFWLPSEASAELYGLATPPGRRMTDTCYVKVYDEVGDDVRRRRRRRAAASTAATASTRRTSSPTSTSSSTSCRSSAAARRSRRCAS